MEEPTYDIETLIDDIFDIMDKRVLDREKWKNTFEASKNVIKAALVDAYKLGAYDQRLLCEEEAYGLLNEHDDPTEWPSLIGKTVLSKPQ